MLSSTQKIEAYFAKESPFKKGLNELRKLALETEFDETLKWGAPVYTIDGKNVLGIISFKSYFGLWFYNGCYLKDPFNVLENAQEGKTKAMRHWKFLSDKNLPLSKIKGYMQEAIENQKNGLQWTPERKKKTIIPELLKVKLTEDPELEKAFAGFTPFKRREFCEYIDSAKQEKTKLSRLEKILPMIREGIGINDKYRKA